MLSCFFLPVVFYLLSICCPMSTSQGVVPSQLSDIKMVHLHSIFAARSVNRWCSRLAAAFHTKKVWFG
jgi:hypothetical protein